MKEFQQQISDFQKFLRGFPIDELIDSMKYTAEKAPERFLILTNYCWFLGYDSLPKTPAELGRKLKKGEIEEVDIFLMDYYEDTLDNIERRLTHRNTNRKHLFEEAFRNHREKRYHSAITLFLTQADGICYDKTGKFFFRNNRDLARKNIFKPQIEEDLRVKENNFVFHPFKTPIDQPIAINDLSENVTNFPIKLNRHEIIHGMDTGFGTKLNSLKIISFINYVNDIIHL